MVAISPQTLPMLLTIASMAVLAPTGLAQLLPPFIPIPGAPLPGLIPPLLPGGQQCLSSFTSIPGCVVEVYSLLFKGQIGVIGPACCKAITQISDNCWTKLFPFNPFFPPLLKNSCTAPSPKGIETTTVSKFGLPVQDIAQCWSSLTNTEWCILEMYKSLIKGQIGVIGPACCNAISKINDKCWPKMFPFNPFFPPFLKSACAHGSKAAPAPHGSKAAPAPHGRKAAPAPHGSKAAPAPHGSKAAPAPHGSKAAPAPHGSKAAPAPHGSKAAPAPHGS